MQTLRPTKIKGWFEYYREMCPICHKTGGCIRNEEGNKVACIRVPSEIVFSSKFMSYLHVLDGGHQHKHVTFKQKDVKQHPKSRFLDGNFRDILGKLSLNQKHFQDLTSADRGLNHYQIKLRGYKSLTEKELKSLTFNNPLLAGTPGLYKDNHGKWRIYGVEGLLIPYRDCHNLIKGCQLRVDNPRNSVSIDNSKFPSLHAVLLSDNHTVQVLVEGEIIQEVKMELGQTIPIFHNEESGTITLKQGQKYIWLSSANKNEGCGAGDPLPIHVAVPIKKLDDMEYEYSYFEGTIKAKSVWITEGALKADIASDHIQKAFSPEEINMYGDTILAVAGVNSFAYVLPALKRMDVEQVNIAFDMDAFTNEYVKNALVNFVDALKKEGYKINLAVWNSEDGKGIDDLFINSKRPQLRPIEY